MLADDDVARLDVAVQDAPAVGVVDGVADVEEPPEQLRSSSERRPGSLQRLVGVEVLDGLLQQSPLMNRMA